MKKIIVVSILLIIFFSFIQVVHVQAASDPIAHFKFDEGSGTTPDDSSINNISASFTSTNPTWSTDISSTITFSNPYSLDFTGNGDGVTVSWPADLDFSATEPRSFSFWYKPVANGEGQYSRIISWSNDRLEIAGTNGTTTSHKIAYFDGNWNDTDITLTLGTWYHVIFTYNGSVAKFYINNELQDEHSLAGRALSGTLRIGNRVQQLDEGVNGKIDDVRIYDYALNANQIENLSSGSNNPDGDPTPTPTPTPTATSVTSSSNSSVTSTTTTPTCSSQSPNAAPNLFQVSTSPTNATLYFTPVNPATGYSIMYGPNTDANQYGVTFNYINGNGAVSYTINELAKGTRYYFKVQGKNNCATGNWSQTLSQTTTNDSSQVSPITTLLPKRTLEVVNKMQTSNTKEETAQEKKPNNEATAEDGYDLTIKVINDGKPIEGASVEIHSTPRKTITDKDGVARFSNVEKGNHTVYLSYKEYQGEEKITVDGKEKKIDVSLTVELKPSNTFFSPMAIGVILLLVAILIFLFWKRKKSEENQRKP